MFDTCENKRIKYYTINQRMPQMNHHPLSLHNPDLWFPPTETVLSTLLTEYIPDEELCNVLSNKLNKIYSFALFPKHIYSSVQRVKLFLQTLSCQMLPVLCAFIKEMNSNLCHHVWPKCLFIDPPGFPINSLKRKRHGRMWLLFWSHTQRCSINTWVHIPTASSPHPVDQF